MLSKTECYYSLAVATPIGTTSFTYESGRSDVLSKITLPDGQTFTPTHDIVGNPSHVMTGNGTRYAATWSYGRRLTGLSSGSEAFSYSYNADGIRTTKTVNGVKHTYALSGTTILNEEWTENGSQIIKETVYSGSTELYTLVYLYDENGAPIGYRYRTPSYARGVFDGYFFEKNLQGDIVAVYNQNGIKVAGYAYDAWGSCTTTYYNGGANTAAKYNPFRYRGYYYDSETGLYYLQSRYYDSAMGRFISADAYVSTGQGLLGFNMFAYCGNNQVNRIDSEGQFWLSAILVTVAFISIPMLLSSCVTGNSNANTGLYVNEYTSDKGYLSGSDCDELARAIAPEIISKSEAINFDQEYGSVIYRFNEGNRYGEDTSVYWISPPHKGSNGRDYFEVKAWDPTDARLPCDITIVGDIHIHFPNASCDANGGFSSADIVAMNAFPGIYYVITQPIGYETKYAISKYDNKKGIGVYLK